MMWLLVTTILMGYLYVLGLGMPLVGPDEPRYAEVAREMFLRWDWITPTLGGHNWFEKPSLLYWLQMLSYSVFGVSEFAARLGSAVFGLATSFALFFLGMYREGGYRLQKDHAPLPYWMLAVPAFSLGLIVFSHGGSFDIIVTFPLTAALVSFYMWFLAADRGRPPGKRIPFLAAFYFFAGVAVLAKGLIGIVFPAAIVSFFYLLRREFPKKEFVVGVLWGALVTIGVAATWYLPMYLRHGWEFIDQFFVQHHFERYISNKFKHPQSFWFFWVIFPLMTIPWLPFFFAGVWKYGKSVVRDWKPLVLKKAKRPSERPDPLAVFAFAWMLVPLVFFSFSGSKLPGYVLPSVPAAAILAALYIEKFASRSRTKEMLCRATVIAMFFVCFLLFLFVVPKYADEDSAKSLVRAVDKAGFKEKRIAGFLSRNHSLEFYAAGRLYRSEDGELKEFKTPKEIADLARTQADGTAIVISPEWVVKRLEKDPSLETKVIARRGEYIVLSARRK